ncbi:uncharacterized protein PRCAT00005392001 [Priceomyces carsonii]|uniref:uncharacterized protein n=1 Tax=Priceomyces carsonii TaxID=28549 RepID=UPI002ED7DA91|nr:unnamed protein product [Priceomyces carsonii]
MKCFSKLQESCARRAIRATAFKGFRCLSLKSRPMASVPFNMGQPTHETRPHYLPKPGNLTPGITALEYYNRRLKLADKLSEKSIVVLTSNQVQYSSGSVFYDFQQDNDFYYLTGWLEPNSVAIIEKVLSSRTDDSVVFHMLAPQKNPQIELWEGDRLGPQGAYDFFNADVVDDIENIKTYMQKLLKNVDVVFWDDKSLNSGGNSLSKFLSFFNLKALNSGLVTILDLIQKSSKPIRSPKSMIAELRSVKSPAEINVMHAAGKISSRAFNKAIAKVGSQEPIHTERTLAKFLDYQFVHGGCDKQAYIPVVASGKNALTIHYTRNDDLLYKDELVFVDAGGKLGGYCSDISRTWPNSPEGFSGPQKDIYEVVLNANKACIDLCCESSHMSVHDIHEFSVKFLTKELNQLKGFEGISSSTVSRILYPHYIGHHLGLDLHDVPSLSKINNIVSGNVLTIEPGLYIPENDNWPKWYRGIGVRVEDDIVVGKESKDILNLSSGCVKEVVDIESLISSGKVTTPGAYDETVILDI